MRRFTYLSGDSASLGSPASASWRGGIPKLASETSARNATRPWVPMVPSRVVSTSAAAISKGGGAMGDCGVPCAHELRNAERLANTHRAQSRRRRGRWSLLRVCSGVLLNLGGSKGIKPGRPTTAVHDLRCPKAAGCTREAGDGARGAPSCGSAAPGGSRSPAAAPAAPPAAAAPVAAAAAARATAPCASARARARGGCGWRGRHGGVR